MKGIFLAVFCLTCNYTFCQSDSIIVKTSPGLIRKLERIIIVNSFLIKDSTTATVLLRNLEPLIKKRKFYTNKESYRRWSIIAPDGVLFYKTKKKIIIDIKSMEVVKNSGR